ncbi:hypothetical protein [Vogesella oryzae]|uniref:hypothetical protein n=1 Tax=Vogesella oryzae TaxID=1735285 RepID=UPI001582343F|nr:hypothetical protein [Vogesella oryzae]
MNAALLLWGVVVSSVGFGYFIYGKKQRALVPLLCGIALMVVPYLIASSWQLVAAGVAIAAVPYFVRL